MVITVMLILALIVQCCTVVIQSKTIRLLKEENANMRKWLSR